MKGEITSTNLEILKEFSGLPFQGVFDEEYRLSAILIVSSEPEKTLKLLKLRLLLNFTHLKLLTKTVSNLKPDENKHLIKYVIPNINVSENLNLFNQDDIICEEEKSLELKKISDAKIDFPIPT